MNEIYIIAIIIILYLLIEKNNENFEDVNKNIRHNDIKLFSLYKKAKLSKYLDNNKKSQNEINIYPKKYKIAFLTLEDRDEEYIDYHNRNTKKYCDKWGYEYIHIKKNETNISPYWYKIFLVFDLIKSNKYDYVFWMDSDTIINNFNIDLGEHILNKYTSDIFVASDNIRYDVVNAGLFVIKNSEIGKQFMQDWINLYSPICEKGNGKLKGVWAMSCYEQGTLNKLLIEKYHKYFTFLDGSIFQNNNYCSSEAFITHFYGGDMKKRSLCFKKQQI